MDLEVTNAQIKPESGVSPLAVIAYVFERIQHESLDKPGAVAVKEEMLEEL